MTTRMPAEAYAQIGPLAPWAILFRHDDTTLLSLFAAFTTYFRTIFITLLRQPLLRRCFHIDIFYILIHVSLIKPK